MKFRMAENSLFAILLRSAWWISALVALAVLGLAFAWLPPAYVVVGATAAVPFAVIAAIAAWRQWRTPGARQVADTRDALRSMSWPRFADVMAAALTRDGYVVQALNDAAADFEARRDGLVTLVACKRWKAARLGVDPLRALDGLRDDRGAHVCLFVVTGEVGDAARRYAAEHRIRIVDDVELTRLTAPVLRASG